MDRPILVTGTHRSGTTWVGRMLALSPTVRYIHEPFAPMYKRSWLRTPPEERFYHEPPTATGRFANDLDRIVALRPPWPTIAKRASGARNAIRIGQDAILTANARRRGARALIKDPFALLAAEWIAARTSADVIVLVRHPAAFASSIKRLGWRLDVSWLLNQPDLIEGDLAPFKSELIADRAGTSDLIDHAALVWRVLNSVVHRYDLDHPGWRVVRYEDIAQNPVPGFRALYDYAAIPWNARTSREIERLNSAENPTEVRASSKGGTRRNSRQATLTWRTRLTGVEAARMREATSDVSQYWYSDDSWWS